MGFGFNLEKKLGFGFLRLPLLSADNGDIDYAAVNRMVDIYIEAGYKYFETAFNYHNGNAEKAIRKCVVERYQRDRFILADKMPVNQISKKEQYGSIFDKQLDNCGVSYFDFYLLHNIGSENYERTKILGGFEFLQQLKQDGKIKYAGFSFHDTADVLDKILCEHPEIDFVQLQINYLDWDSPAIQSGKCYKVARRHNKPIIVMEPIKGGMLVAGLPEEAVNMLRQANKDMSPAEFALRYCAGLDGVIMVLSGMSTISQVTENVRKMSCPLPLSQTESEAIIKVKEIIQGSNRIQCTNCRYCVESCPQKIPIPEIFALYNDIYGKNIKSVTGIGHYRFLYERATYGKGKATACLKCGICERYCPQHLEVRKLLRKTSDLFDKGVNGPMYSDIKSVQALIVLLKEYGVRKIVLSPGMRNVPIVHSVEQDDFFQCYSMVDERSAAYFAMGLAQESGETVAICCTSGTAAVNYSPAVYEAFFQKVPLVVITAARNPQYLYQLEDQCVPQSHLYDGVCKKSVTLPIVKDDIDYWYCIRILNEAFMELNHNGKGPIHINVPIEHGIVSFNTGELPPLTAIKRTILAKCTAEEKEALKKKLKSYKRILLIYGQSLPASESKKILVENFVSNYNCVVAVEHISNLKCKGTVNIYLACNVLTNDVFEKFAPDLVISMEGQFLSSLRYLLIDCRKKFEYWCVNETGTVVDPLRKLTHVFEGNSEEFFEFFKGCENANAFENEYLKLWNERLERLKKVKQYGFPFSNNYAIQKIMQNVPKGVLMHFGTDTIVRLSQCFDLDQSITVYANRGTTGIDGTLSSFIGQAAAGDRLSFLLIGDLSFFYDMNGLWNRYVGRNIRILLSNNEGGETFYWNGAKHVENRHVYIAAEHFSTAEGWAKSQGLRYLSARNKEEFDYLLPEFLSEESDTPILFELFTKKDKDAEIMDEFFDKCRLHFYGIEDKVKEGKRIIIYGAGARGGFIASMLQKYKCSIICYCDSDSNKWGQKYLNKEIISPEELVKRKGSYDAIVISSTRYYEEIKKKLDSLGFSSDSYFGFI